MSRLRGCHYENVSMALRPDTDTAGLLTDEDSGSLAIDYAAGTPLFIEVTRASKCRGLTADANLVVQYRAR